MAWYRKEKIMGYNKVFNFVIGNRGGGKTFCFKEFAIKDFIKNGNEFIWVRRYKSELTNSKLEEFLNDIIEFFPNVEFKLKGKKVYINGEKAGEFIPLSTAHNYKSIPFPKVTKIIFDEFLLDKGCTKYINKDEPTAFMELCSTIIRKRDNVKVFFLANAISVVNPYFSYFNLKVKPNQAFNIYEDIALEIYKDSEFVEEMKQTPFGKLATKTKYGKYAIDNEFLRDDESFIIQRPKNPYYWVGLKINGKWYSVWNCTDKLFVQEGYDNTQRAYVLSAEEMEMDIAHVNVIKDKPIIKIIKDSFYLSKVYFDNQQTKQDFIQAIRLL